MGKLVKGKVNEYIDNLLDDGEAYSWRKIIDCVENDLGVEYRNSANSYLRRSVNNGKLKRGNWGEYIKASAYAFMKDAKVIEDIESHLNAVKVLLSNYTHSNASLLVDALCSSEYDIESVTRYTNLKNIETLVDSCMAVLNNDSYSKSISLLDLDALLNRK